MVRSRHLGRAALALAAPLAILGGPQAAQADFHPACVGVVTGDAYVAWAAGATHVASGTVECPGAFSVSVTITLSSLTDPEFETLTSTASCSILTLTCLDPVTAQRSGAFDDGTYKLHMSFNAQGPVGPVTTWTNVQRCGVWTVTGSTAAGPGAC